MRPLYAGHVLRIDLTHGRIVTEPLSDQDRLIGGKAVNLKLLFDTLEADTKPLDAQNPLIFGVGPLVGTPFPGACRMDIVARSPVTHALGDSGMGGYFGAELKYAGYDHLVITGKAEEPVYLNIRDDRVEIEDASAIWGRDTYETAAMVRDRVGDPEAKVIGIGPAGENRVAYACIMSATGNAASRTGLGAVMGSKNLKAIAVRGSRGISIAQPRRFLERCSDLLDAVKSAPFYDELHAVGLTRIHDREMRSAYEFLGSDWRGGEEICELDFLEKHLDRRVGCFSCPVACFDGYRIDGVGSGAIRCSPYGDLSWDLRNPDLMVCWQAFADCQRYGLDARSRSNTIAWLMTLHEKGIITKATTDGIPMQWGSKEAILCMPKKMSFREGIGDLLAEGLPVAAQTFGKGAKDFLFISKGSPTDMHVPPIKTRALASAVSAIGEDAQVQPFLDAVSARRYIQIGDETSFQEAIHRYKDRAETQVGIRNAADPRTTEGKAALVRHDEERTDIADITGVCTWMTSFIALPVDAGVIAECMSLGLGETVDVPALSDAATRLRHLERAIQAKCGLTRADDTVSNGYYDRIQPEGEPVPELGFTDAQLEAMKDDYYRMLGWDVTTGLPTRETLDASGLSDVADDWIP